MRTQRSGNFIPLPTKPAKSTPKPLLRPLAARKSSSAQTETTVLVKEENITFYPCTKLSHNDGGMRRDYIKAINYINSCHKFINAIIEKNYPEKHNFLLPMATNFAPLFPFLIGKKTAKKEKPPCASTETKKQSENKIYVPPNKKSTERKSKSGLSMKSSKKTNSEENNFPTALPAGDCEERILSQSKINEDQYASQVADMVKEHIHQFLSSLQGDIYNATKTTNVTTYKYKSKDNTTTRQELFTTENDLENTSEQVSSRSQRVPTNCRQVLTTELPEDCSVILSDTDCEEIKTVEKHLSQPIKITHYYEKGSVSSITSESSDIKSDTDIEINRRQ